MPGESHMRQFSAREIYVAQLQVVGVISPGGSTTYECTVRHDMRMAADILHCSCTKLPGPQSGPLDSLSPTGNDMPVLQNAATPGQPGPSVALPTTGTDMPLPSQYPRRAPYGKACESCRMKRKRCPHRSDGFEESNTAPTAVVASSAMSGSNPDPQSALQDAEAVDTQSGPSDSLSPTENDMPVLQDAAAGVAEQHAELEAEMQRHVNEKAQAEENIARIQAQMTTRSLQHAAANRGPSRAPRGKACFSCRMKKKRCPHVVASSASPEDNPTQGSSLQDAEAVVGCPVSHVAWQAGWIEGCTCPKHPRHSSRRPDNFVPAAPTQWVPQESSSAPSDNLPASWSVSVGALARNIGRRSLPDGQPESSLQGSTQGLTADSTHDPPTPQETYVFEDGETPQEPNNESPRLMSASQESTFQAHKQHIPPPAVMVSPANYNDHSTHEYQPIKVESLGKLSCLLLASALC